jgi:hypothetical protein
MPGRLSSELMSAAWKALLVESAPTPIDSRKSMAGSSASKLRHTKHVSDMNEAKCRARPAHLFTTSILLLDSQRGILHKAKYDSCQTYTCKKLRSSSTGGSTYSANL